MIVALISVGGGVGAVLGGVYAALYQRRKVSQVEKLEDSVLAIVRGARTMLHIYSGKRLNGSIRMEMNAAQALVRVSNDVIALVGDEDVQRAARLLRRHVYSLRSELEGAKDPRSGYGSSPYQRVEGAINLLLQVTRRQSGWGGQVVTVFDFDALADAAGKFTPSA